MSAEPQQRSSMVDDMLCLALHSASRAMTGRYRTFLKPFGVTYPQYLVLLVLEQDGRSSLVGIGTRLRLESSTLSPLLRRLESIGLVSRTRSTEDERQVTIELTQAGHRLCGDLLAVPDQISHATGLDPAEQVTLVRTLHRLESQLRG